MGLLNKIKDSFTKTEFSVAPQMKLKTLSKEFNKTFGLDLVFYKGVHIADENLTLNQLNQQTSKEVNTSGKSFKLKGSTKVGEAEKMFDEKFGVKVQIKDGDKCVSNSLTIGEAARGDK